MTRYSKKNIDKYATLIKKELVNMLMVDLNHAEVIEEKNKRIAELEKEITPTYEELNPGNYYNFCLADKLRYRESQIALTLKREQVQREKLEDLEIKLAKSRFLRDSESEEWNANKNNLAIEKLEELLKFIYENKWTNIELCTETAPLKIIRNKLNSMIESLKGVKK